MTEVVIKVSEGVVARIVIVVRMSTRGVVIHTPPVEKRFAMEIFIFWSVLVLSRGLFFLLLNFGVFTVRGFFVSLFLPISIFWP